MTWRYPKETQTKKPTKKKVINSQARSFWLPLFSWHLYLPSLFQSHSRDPFLLPVSPPSDFCITTAGDVLYPHVTQVLHFSRASSCREDGGAHPLGELYGDQTDTACGCMDEHSFALPWSVDERQIYQVAFGPAVELLQNRFWTKIWWVEKDVISHVRPFRFWNKMLQRSQFLERLFSGSKGHRPGCHLLKGPLLRFGS